MPQEKKLRKQGGDNSLGRHKGCVGSPHTKEAKLKISLAHKGNHHSPKTEFKKGHSLLKGRTWDEIRKKQQGKSGRKPTIKNGKEYSPDWNKIRKEIYKRDEWICQECGCKCQDKKGNDTKRTIQCHHIDYNEKNNDFSNLITLCASCHAKTNFTRENWMRYFQEIRKGKNNGKRKSRSR